MNELSNEVKAQEIHERAVGFYKISEQYGYKFLMEIKTIRDEKLYKELGFRNFEDYTRKVFGYTSETIRQRIKAAEVFGEDETNARWDLGTRKLNTLATFPENERNKVFEHGIETDKGNKTIDEATTREIEEYKKQLKQRDEEKSQLESQLEQAQRSESIARKQLEDAEDREPEVIERYMEPEDYEVSKNENSELKRKNSSLEQQIEYYKRKLELKKEDKVVENNSKENEITDARIQINQDNDSIEPEVRKAIRHESSADALITALEEIITIHDQEIEDYELFDKYVSTLNYKALIEAKKKIEHFIKIGGYK
ncbi:hypothetical protein [Staphylococcus sp. ZWU0021]|uniref:hypothetical protein n=1 Tax=Staphylococcus sp. ZWU0021 TaxID=1339238 RepID=UPI000691C96B|nr:hypothetical protein [Staphylococcus sp. ZWU0021]